MSTNLTSDQVADKLRSVMYASDSITNKNPKFHTVAVHEAACARWVLVEFTDEDGTSTFKPARFTPGVVKRAVEAAHKNFDDFEDREDIPTDASRIAELEAQVAELGAAKAELQMEASTLAQQVSEAESRASAAEAAASSAADASTAKVQTIAADLVKADASKGWFAGDGWWKGVLRKHGANV